MPHVYVGLDGDEGDGSVGSLLVNLVLDTSFTSFLDHTSECITKYEQEILIERLEGFHRFIPVSDGKEPCNGDFLKSLIENGKHKCSGNNTHFKITALLLRCCYHVSFNRQMNRQLCRWPEGAVFERAWRNCRVHTRGYLVSMVFEAPPTIFQCT
jgi:hypothetical protein